MSVQIFERLDWGGVIVALIAASPGLFALLTRNKAVTARSAVAMKRSTVDEFNALFAEQRQQIEECRSAWAQERTERTALEAKVDVLENEVHTLTNDLRDERERRSFLEHVVRMRGGIPDEGGKP